MTWIVVKQYFLTGSQDPEWATKQQFWSQLSGSGDTQTFSFDNLSKFISSLFTTSSGA